MLRIATARDTDTAVGLQLEGAVIGAWVDELRRVSEPILSAGRGLDLDLAGVSFVSREGALLLAALRSRGVALHNSSALVTEQLKAHVAHAVPGGRA